MGTGWRRAFCKTIPRNKEPKQNHSINNNQQEEEESQIHQNSSSSQIKTGGKLRLFSSISNPSTPRFSSVPAATTTPNLRCRTAAAAGEPQSADNTPRLQCRTSEKKSQNPRRKFASNPSSPRSPFSILKNTLRLSKNGCGVCLQSAKTGRGMAIYTAECSHSFHFPCIAQYAQKQGSLICPVCNVTWKDVPLLSVHKSVSDQDDVVEKTITTTTTTANSPSISAVKSNHDRSEPFDDSINRAFNDDEPLVSPAGAARFKPIPEAEDEFNEESNGEVEEFKGFFVNSTPSTPTKKHNSSKFFHDRRTQRNVEFKILPEAAVISIGRSHETFAVALRVKAPLPPPPSADGGGNASTVLSPSNRAPIDLVTVLDVGESMTTAKLHMLKRAMRLVISSLGSSDRLSIVSFSSDSHRLLPLRRMTPQGHRLGRRIVDQLSTGEGKSLSSAMKIAAKVLEDRREKNPVASIILLSDGKDEESSQNQRQSTSHVSATSTRFGHIEIPVHSYGFGGTGGSIADALAKRVGGLLSVVVQDLRVQLGFSSGSSPCEITAVYSCNGRPSSLSYDSIRLGDLYAEEERELLVELRVPTSAIGSHHVMSVRCSYKDPATGEVMYGRERALLVPRPHAVRSSDPRIERLRNVFVATRAVAETRRMVEYGEFGSAQRLLVSARALVAQSGSASAEEYVRWLEGELNELHWRRQYQVQQREQELMVRHHQHVEFVDENGEPLTPTSAWGAAERLAKVAMMKQSLNRSGDLHGFENARF
ncbi:hypothetical protein V2J09_017185 [Rumex salicifolius]